MRRENKILTLSLLLSGVLATVSVADEDINQRSLNLEKKKFELRLANRFGVSDEQIEGLRQQNLGYGEISTVFSLAKQMPGGVNDKNIQTIMNRRQGGPRKIGWGQIAQELNIRVEPVVREVAYIRDEVQRDEANWVARNMKPMQPLNNSIKPSRSYRESLR